MSDNSFYIVRGAKMFCDKGTHKRKINLPVSHGSYVKSKPKMNRCDVVPEENISYFGICNGECKEGEGDIYLVGEDGSTVSGKKCCFEAFDLWQQCKEDALVDGEPAIISDSYLICAHGGIIQFATTGQEDE